MPLRPSRTVLSLPLPLSRGTPLCRPNVSKHEWREGVPYFLSTRRSVSLLALKSCSQCARPISSRTSGLERSNLARLHGQRAGRRGIWTATRTSFRSLRMAFRNNTLRNLFHQSPEELLLALVVLLLCTVAVIYVVRIYFTYFNSEQFTRFPPPVAKSLRRALYYSNYNPDPVLALKYYKRALEQCAELKLDPFSDEVMGIKIQLAAWLEKNGHYPESIQVLETLLADCTRWIATMEKSESRADGAMPRLDVQTSSSVEAGQDSSSEATPETIWGKRTRLLGKAVGISVKLGELYSDEHVLQLEVAHERLIWAVESALRELQRRSADGLKEGEGPWMDDEAMGGALESTSRDLDRISQSPLFLQALRLCRDPCHSALLMNNLAASIAQLPANMSYTAAVGAGRDSVTSSTTSTLLRGGRTENLATARRWALNALEHAREPQGEDRTVDCDQACAAALSNLGDIASAAGDGEEARRRFEECDALSRRIGFSQGVTQAQDGLRRLQKTNKQR